MIAKQLGVTATRFSPLFALQPRFDTARKCRPRLGRAQVSKLFLHAPQLIAELQLIFILVLQVEIRIAHHTQSVFLERICLKNLEKIRSSEFRQPPGISTTRKPTSALLPAAGFIGERQPN